MIKSEEYKVVGFVKKICVCDKCMIEMQKSQFITLSNPPQYTMRCPKCGKEENISCEELNGQFKLIKKEK